MEWRLKRIYDPVEADDGYRVLVDRLWPRGVAKEAAALDEWARELAPSDALRRRYHREPGLWDAFVAAYHAELAEHADALAAVLARARAGRVTLLFAARDRERNNAVALRLYLERLGAVGHGIHKEG